MRHEWDEDGMCIHCGFDGAESAWLLRNLRLEIGDDEFNYRKKAGEFDADYRCLKRVSAE